MAIGEHYVIKVFGSYFGEAFLNTYAYRQTAGIATNSAQQLSFQFDSSLLFDLASSTNQSCNYNRMEVFAIENPTDYFDIVPINAQGTRVIGASSRASSWMAFGFKSNRFGAGSRASYKRFCGLGETDINQNELEVAFIALPQVIALGNALAQSLTFGGGNTWIPVQLKAGGVVGAAPVENFVITDYGVPYLTSQVSRRP